MRIGFGRNAAVVTGWRHRSHKSNAFQRWSIRCHRRPVPRRLVGTRKTQRKAVSQRCFPSGSYAPPSPRPLWQRNGRSTARAAASNLHRSATHTLTFFCRESSRVNRTEAGSDGKSNRTGPLRGSGSQNARHRHSVSGAALGRQPATWKCHRSRCRGGRGGTPFEAGDAYQVSGKRGTASQQSLRRGATQCAFPCCVSLRNTVPTLRRSTT